MVLEVADGLGQFLLKSTGRVIVNIIIITLDK